MSTEYPNRSYGENAREETRQEHRDRVRETVRVSLEKAYAKIQEGDHATAGLIAADRLLEALEVDDAMVPVYADHLSESRLPWHQDAIERFRSDATAYISAAATSESDIDASALIASRAAGARPPTDAAKRVIERSVASLESIAVLRGVIEASLTRTVGLSGFSHTMGRWYQQYGMNTEDPYPVAAPHKHGPFTLITGAKGSGKSAHLGSLALDRYAAGHKVIDLHDQSYLENAAYDIPQQQATLRRIREDMGLPAGLDEMDIDPELEILVPLTPELADQDVLYDPEDESYSMRPFAVRASSLPDSVLKTLIGGLPPTGEDVLEAALNAVSGDYSLRELAREAAKVDEKDDIVARVVRALETLQNDGWIRDGECEHIIDWSRIFEATDTITAFSTATMSGDASKMRVIYYLIRSVFRERGGDAEYPRAVALARELHHLAPTQRNRRGEVVEKIQKEIVSELQYFTAEQRHVSLELACDTQQWGQIQRQIRRQVDISVMHRVHGAAAQRVFEDMLGDRFEQYANKVNQQDTGEATIIGPSWIGTAGDGIEFIRPAQMSPPGCHNIDPNQGIGDGWNARARYLDEDLRDAPEEWQCELPDRLRFDADGDEESVVADDVEESDDVPGPVVGFVRSGVRVDEDARVAKEDVRAAIRGYAAAHDALDDLPDTDSDLGSAFMDSLSEDVREQVGTNALTKKSEDRTESRRSAYDGIGLSERGESLREEWESQIMVGGDVEGLPEDDVLECLYAAEVRSDGDEWVPVESTDDDRVSFESEMKRRTELGYGHKFARVVEQLGGDVVNKERHSGEQVIQLTSHGRARTVTQDSGGHKGGKYEHRELTRRAFEVLTRLGLIVSVPNQDGEAIPDAVADLPVSTDFDPANVDGIPEDVTVSELSVEDMQRVVEEREAHQKTVVEDLRDHHENLPGITTDDAYVEIESGTAGSWQTVHNLSKAVNKGRECVFVTKSGDEEFTEYARKIARVLTNPPCMSEKSSDGDRLYTRSTWEQHDLSVHGRDGVAMWRKSVRGAWWDRPGKDGLTYERVGSGDVIAQVSEDDIKREVIPVESGFAFAEEEDGGIVVRQYDEDRGEVVDVERYESKDAMGEEWTSASPPIHPSIHFREEPTDDMWSVVVIPDDDSEEFEEAQFYDAETEDLTPVFSGSVGSD